MSQREFVYALGDSLDKANYCTNTRLFELVELGLYALRTATIGYVLYLLEFDFYSLTTRLTLQEDQLIDTLVDEVIWNRVHHDLSVNEQLDGFSSVSVMIIRCDCMLSGQPQRNGWML